MVTTSDKSFRQVIRRHRKNAGLTDVDDVALENVECVDAIPDLFLTSARDFPAQTSDPIEWADFARQGLFTAVDGYPHMRKLSKRPDGTAKVVLERGKSERRGPRVAVA